MEAVLTPFGRGTVVNFRPEDGVYEVCYAGSPEDGVFLLVDEVSDEKSGNLCASMPIRRPRKPKL